MTTPRAVMLPAGLRVPVPGTRQLVAVGAAAAAVVALFTVALPHLHVPTGSGRWQTPLPFVLLGLVQGMVYGLLAVGLVLVYRSNRIINFAHGQVGAFGAALFGTFVVKGHVPYYVALGPALALAGGTGYLTETVVIRRLRKAPPLMSIVATLGVGQLLLALVAVFDSQAGAGRLFPQPPLLPTFSIGVLRVTSSYFAMLVFAPLVVLGVGAFLKFSKVGIGIRAAAANPGAARMAGIFSGRMSGLVWALAGSLAAFGAILTLPGQSFTNAASFGPSLLLRALAGAVLGRMVSLPLALLGGIGIGVLESLLDVNYGDAGTVEVALFVVIVVAMLAQRQRIGRAEEKGSWAAVQAFRPLPAALRQVWLIRNLGLLVAVAVLGFFLLLPLGISNADCVKITGILGFIVIGISVGIVTGLAGQLSLGQFAIAAIGAVASFQVARRTGSYLESFAYAGAASALVSVLIGLPALRVKGLLLTVTTLSFALVVPDYLLGRPWAFGPGRDPGRPTVLGDPLVRGKQYIYLALAVLVIATLLARNVRRGGIGRLLVSVRDNEDAARAFTVPAARVKIQAFALAGFLAGIGGALYAHSLPLVSQTSFTTQASLDVVTMTVIGGVGILAGPYLGSIVVLFLPEFVPLGSFALFASAFGQLVILVFLPGGLAEFVTPLRDRVARVVGARMGIDVDAAYLVESSSGAALDTPAAALGGIPPTAVERRPAPVPVAGQHGSAHLLEASGLRKSFGGVRAVRGVSFVVRQGETLGLIGPNGAGKTTTFELLAGFTKADEGAVHFAGHDITYLGPEARGRLGLIRSFQDAALFPTLTVTECVQLSLERVEPTRLLPAIAGLTRQERRKERAARDLVAWMGLDRYRSAQIQELSTGTRRITEIACLVALEPRMLLLDEPSSGVAQKETEALGALLERLREQLQLTLIVIEHDIPLIMGLSDRIVAMADGQVIAQGTPDVVRHDPAVVEAYLGGSITAIERSGSATGRAPEVRAGPAAPAKAPAGALSTLAGLSAMRAETLLRHFGSVEALRGASAADLCALPGIGVGTARRVLEALAEER